MTKKLVRYLALFWGKLEAFIVGKGTKLDTPAVSDANNVKSTESAPVVNSNPITKSCTRCKAFQGISPGQIVVVTTRKPGGEIEHVRLANVEYVTYSRLSVNYIGYTPGIYDTHQTINAADVASGRITVRPSTPIKSYAYEPETNRIDYVPERKKSRGSSACERVYIDDTTYGSRRSDSDDFLAGMVVGSMLNSHDEQPYGGGSGCGAGSTRSFGYDIAQAIAENTHSPQAYESNTYDTPSYTSTNSDASGSSWDSWTSGADFSPSSGD